MPIYQLAEKNVHKHLKPIQATIIHLKEEEETLFVTGLLSNVVYRVLREEGGWEVGWNRSTTELLWFFNQNECFLGLIYYCNIAGLDTYR